ncbi:MAG TPA: phosphoglycerate dehydrogenase, partial [Chloroflexi bacterium]|nr:phosphoglycerate dehydrogenase [Chloroflexota bacterium]HCG29989.1 phosphoglycerate dehydrogenase [Chloroflexota bacterium]
PHIGGSSGAALAAVGEIISRSTLAALRGEAVANAVNLPTATLESAELARLTRVAGAAGHLLGVLSSGIPEAVIMRIHGEVVGAVAEHVFLAALSEGLQHWTTTRVTPVNARIVAEQHRIAARIVAADGRQPAPADAIDFSFEAAGDGAHVVRIRWSGGSAGIIEVDRFSLDHPLAGDMLITHHRDRPGMIGHVGMILGRHDVNIAGMQVGRHYRGGEA